jgi:hypothetical protein
MGSGSTLAAAEAMGLNAIGVERYIDYFESSRQAIPALAKLKILFEHWGTEPTKLSSPQIPKQMPMELVVG